MIIDIEAEVVPKQRPRKMTKISYLTKKGKFVVAGLYTPKKVRSNKAFLKEMIAMYMEENNLLMFPKEMLIQFGFIVFTRRKRGTANIVDFYNAIVDAGTKIMWEDSIQIIRWSESSICYETKRERLILLVSVTAPDKE